MLRKIEQMSSRGVNVKIVSGSFRSDNHTAVYSHHRKYRHKILAAGAKLYEFRHAPTEGIREISDVPSVRARFNVARNALTVCV